MKKTLNKLFYICIITIAMPLNIHFILTGRIWLGVLLILMQLPYLITSFKPIWLGKD